MSQLTTVAEANSLETITEFLEDPSREVRNQAARELYRVNPEFAATFNSAYVKARRPDAVRSARP